MKQIVNLVDVGAAGGIANYWHELMARLDITLVEPNGEAAAALALDYPEARVISQALAEANERRTIYMTAAPDCSSLRKPNMEFLCNYPVAPVFEIVGTETIECVRYDALVQRGLAPSPHILKIDVQGCELEVLKGFGDLMDQCSAVELEAQFYPIYEGQALLNELVDYLKKFGLVLRKIVPQMSFEGDLVEVNAFFTRQPRSELEEEVLKIANWAWKLETSDTGRQFAATLTKRG